MPPVAVAKLQKQLLDWYDLNRRVMPWRARKGRGVNPYHVWLSEIMLQQTTVAAVGPYFLKFTEKWPTVEKLAAARLDDVLAAWAGLGYYARARNLHKCAQAVARDYGGKFPETVNELLELPGIGPYTAAAISSIAFNKPEAAVDGNVERVVSRYFAIEDPLPHSKKKLKKKAEIIVKNNKIPSDFTQAFMELGATVCTPRNPRCGGCPWQASCAARKKGIAAGLPRKAAKKKKPLRYGHLFWITREDGSFLIQKRGERGLYAGMYQLPTTDWTEAKPPATPALRGVKLKKRGVKVLHTFTHFDLELEIWEGSPPNKRALPDTMWIKPQSIDKYALPSLMKKAVRLCAGEARGRRL